MSTVKALKEAVEQSYTKYKKAKNALQRAVDAFTVGSTRTMSMKLQSFEESLDALNTSHTSWVSKAEFDPPALAAETFSDKWLETIWEEADTLADLAHEKIHASETPSESPSLTPANQLLLLQKQMASLKVNITNELDALSTNTKDDKLSPASQAVFAEMTEKVQSQLDSAFSQLSLSILNISGTDTAKTIDEHETFKQTQQKRLLDVRVQLAKLAANTEKAASASATPTQPAATVSSRSVEMEKCKAPTFSGRTIDYPEFKRSWCKVAGVAWDDGNQLEQMKQKVDECTKKIVSRCKSMTEVWDALDMEYGQEQEVVNAVNLELQTLRSVNCSTPEYIIKLRHFLPGLESALESVNGLEHLRTPDKVNYLIQKFDERTLYDWEYFRSKSEGKTYEQFFNFILDRYEACKSTVARLNSLNENDSTKLSVNHTTISCFKCTKWVAKGCSVTCPGCETVTAQGNQLGHCLEHCTQYQAMNPNQRSDCVQAANWCPVHLSYSHDLSSCTQRTDPKVLCGVSGCDKHHHRSLHGSTTQFVVSVNTIAINNINVVPADQSPTNSIINDTANTQVPLSNKDISPTVPCSAVPNIDSSSEQVNSASNDVGMQEPSSNTDISSTLPCDTEHSINQSPQLDLTLTTSSDQVHATSENLDTGSNTGNVLLLFQDIDTTSGKMNCFYDNGSTCSLILDSAAERLQLVGEDVEVTVTAVTGIEVFRTRFYRLKLVDNNGKEHSVTAFGVPKISDAINEVCLDNLKGLFSPETQQLWDQVDTRPAGEVEFLLGGNYLGLHPVDHESFENVKILKSKFGSGYLAAGCHHSIHATQVTFGPTVAALRVHHTTLTYKSVRDYFDSNDLEVPVPRRCNNCMKCEECRFLTQHMSVEGQYEYRIMEKNVHYVEADKEFRVNYVFTESPSILTDNEGQVIKIAQREEKLLEKENLTESFNAEFNKMLDHGAIAELSKQDRQAWNGPVHHVSLQHVHKPNSPTTPLRIVTNSSLSDRNGISLNSILMKGPNILSNQFEVLTRWRSYEIAMNADLTKAYYAMKTGELEKHVRRVVWRFGDSSKEWRYFAFQTVSFGDKPAGVYLNIVINKTADRFENIDPEAALKIKNDRYADDLLTGGSPELVNRLKGANTNPSDKFETDGTAAEMLQKGNLKLKVVVTSGEDDPEKINKLGGSALGLGWDPPRDILTIDMCYDSLPDPRIDAELLQISLTLRTILGFVNKPYDLLGLLSPITIQPKVAYRNLFRMEIKLSWDDEIPQEERGKWHALLNLISSMGSVEIRRSTRPKNAVGSPDIVGFFVFGV